MEAIGPSKDPNNSRDSFIRSHLSNVHAMAWMVSAVGAFFLSRDFQGGRGNLVGIGVEALVTSTALFLASGKYDGRVVSRLEKP